jgi:phage replication O-like protein O
MAMADPRLENGFIRIPNELIEAFIKYRLSGLQKDVVLCIVRQTDGYHKFASKLSLRYIAKKINSSHARVSEALSVLIDKNIVVVIQDNSKRRSPRVIALNKDYDTWESNAPLAKSVEFEEEQQESPKVRNRNSSESGNNLNIDNKDKIKNAREFELFWQEYPRKVAKKKAMLLFSKLNLNDRLIEEIITALKQQKESDQWQNTKYIPHPTTWLSQERWNDEIEPVQEVEQNNPEEDYLHEGSVLSYTQKHLINQEIINEE